MELLIEQEINNCYVALQNGGVILYPTDTVWGLGCNPFNENAVNLIFKIKERAASKSLILLFSSVNMLKEYVSIHFDESFLISKCPTTFIFDQNVRFPEYLKAEDGSVACRISNNKFNQLLINKFGKPIISTSANISGEPTASHFEEIHEKIKYNVDYVVNKHFEEHSNSKPSKIVKVEANNKFTILRA